MSNSTVPAGVASLLESGEYSDLKLKCGDRVFNVHKAIVCTQSEFLAKACNGPFKEAESGVIDLADDDLGIVEKTLQYLYTSDYTYNGSDHQGNWEINKDTALDAQLINIAVFAMADRWVIPKLWALAVEKFKSLEDSLQLWIHGVPEILRAIYTTTPQSNRLLRDCIVQLCVEHAHGNRVPLVNWEDASYDEIWTEFPEAHIDLLKATLSANHDSISKLSSNMGKLVTSVSELTSVKDRLEGENAKLKSDIRSLQATPDNWPLMASRLNDLLSESCKTCYKNGYSSHDTKIIHEQCNFAAPYKIQVRCTRCGESREKNYR